MTLFGKRDRWSGGGGSINRIPPDGGPAGGRKTHTKTSKTHRTTKGKVHKKNRKKKLKKLV